MGIVELDLRNLEIHELSIEPVERERSIEIELRATIFDINEESLQRVAGTQLTPVTLLCEESDSTR